MLPAAISEEDHRRIRCSAGRSNNTNTISQTHLLEKTVESSEHLGHRHEAYMYDWWDCNETNIFKLHYMTFQEEGIQASKQQTLMHKLKADTTLYF